MSTCICQVCSRHCEIGEGQTGFCQARTCRNGHNISSNYGKIASIALDPIEKKPFKRFYPGSKILSVGSFGCNYRCPFCQNHSLSMAGEAESEVITLSPEQLVNLALEYRQEGNIGIAYTYNEPLIGYEYVRDCSILAHQKGLKNVVVTNGSVDSAILAELLPHLDALNVDLKGSETFYQNIGGNQSAVKDFITLAQRHAHVEVTALIVPGENDKEEEFLELVNWLASIHSQIPLHISRFFPKYKCMDKEPTKVSHICHLAELAQKQLTYVYTGNI